MIKKPKYDKKIIGMNLRRLREENNISIKDLCIYLGFGEDVQTVYAYEKGRSFPQSYTLLKLMELYGVGVKEITTLNKYPEQKSENMHPALKKILKTLNQENKILKYAKIYFGEISTVSGHSEKSNVNMSKFDLNSILEKVSSRPDYDTEKIGKNLKRLRKKKNLTIKQVCDYLGVKTIQAVYKHEKGDAYPKTENLLALMELYDADAIDIIYGETEFIRNPRPCLCDLVYYIGDYTLMIEIKQKYDKAC